MWHSLDHSTSVLTELYVVGAIVGPCAHYVRRGSLVATNVLDFIPENHLGGLLLLPDLVMVPVINDLS